MYIIKRVPILCNLDVDKTISILILQVQNAFTEPITNKCIIYQKTDALGDEKINILK
jgi:hypothetical protein